MGIAAHLTADRIDRSAMGLDPKERPQRPPSRVIPLGMGPQRRDDLLDDVLGRAPIAGDPPREAEQERDVAIEDLADRLFVAGCHPSDQDPIP